MALFDLISAALAQDGTGAPERLGECGCTADWVVAVVAHHDLASGCLCDYCPWSGDLVPLAVHRITGRDYWWYYFTDSCGWT